MDDIDLFKYILSDIHIFRGETMFGFVIPARELPNRWQDKTG